MTIKEELIVRLRAAREKLGDDWRKQLISNDEYFNSYEGAKIIEHASMAISSDKCRMGIDRLMKITKAMERLAGIEHVPIF